MPRRAAVFALCLCAASSYAVRATAGPVAYSARLSGPSESPPTNSPATGVASVTIDAVTHTMRVQVTFQGLLAPNNAAHIHATTAAPFAGNTGVATTTPTFTAFPSGVTSGTYDRTFDTTQASSYNAAFVSASGGVAGAEAALFTAMANGRAYFNIHTTLYPGGEIRGFLVPEFSDVPLTPAVTVVKAAHVHELRMRIDAQRVRFGLPVYMWSDPTLTEGSTVIKAQHILDLRLALSEAYVAAVRTPPTYSDPGLGPGETVKTTHIAQLRTAVLGLE